MRFSWLRLSLIAGWFLALLAWNFPPGWMASVDAEKPRLLVAVLSGMLTPANIMLSVAVIAVILFVNFNPTAPTY